MSLEHLIPSNVNYQEVNKIYKMKLGVSDIARLMKEEIEYKRSGKSIKIPLSELAFFFDVTSGLTDERQFRSPSRITSLIATLANIEEAERSKNINLKISGKFVLSHENEYEGMADPLMPGHQQDIENKFYNKDIIASNSKVRVEKLAGNFRQLALDDSIASDAMKVFQQYSINRNLASYWSQGQTTYDNASTGELQFIQNVIQNEWNDFGNTWTSHFNYQEQGKKIVVKGDHLPAMKEIEKQKIDILKTRVDIFKILIDSGADFSTAAEMVNLDELKQGTQNGSQEE